MAGTIEGGKKAAIKNMASDPDFYKKIGQVGGRAKSPEKGFGGNKELARAAGAKGGRISRRKPVAAVLEGVER